MMRPDLEDTLMEWLIAPQTDDGRDGIEGD
jgi:hypothetical protein